MRYSGVLFALCAAHAVADDQPGVSELFADPRFQESHQNFPPFGIGNSQDSIPGDQHLTRGIPEGRGHAGGVLDG